VLRLKNSSRWSGKGLGNVYKLMTTIGQGFDVQDGVAQKLDATGFLKNAAITNTRIGYLELPGDDALHNQTRNLAGYWAALAGDPNSATVQPASTKAFAEAGKSKSCEYPTTKASDVNVGDPNQNLDYPSTVQIAPEQDGETVSIDLRTPTKLKAKLDENPQSEVGWKPAAPNQTDQPLPAPTQDIAVTLQADIGKSISKTVFFQNYGSQNSLSEQTR
jgi:hypothetical protein